MKLVFFLQKQLQLILIIFCITLIQSRTIRFRINEELPLNTSIGSLLNYVNGGLNNLHFVKISNHDDYSNLFNVDEFTGDVINVMRLDRETLCNPSNQLHHNDEINEQWIMNLPILHKCELHFSVNCLNTTPFLNISKHMKYKTPISNKLVAIFDVIIELIDINDNGCRFMPSNQQIIHIREDSPVNDTHYVLNTPYDPDDIISGNTVKSDRIWINTDSNQHISSLFKLHSQSSSKNTTYNIYLELELIGKLDYEKQTNYSLQIVADDGFMSGEHECRLNVTVLVEDCNDHIPSFEQSIYTVNISEDTPIDQLIIKLKANDLDKHENGRIIYSFSSYTDDVDDEKFFYIHSDSGEIRLRNRLNYRQKPQHILKVFAKNPDSTIPRHLKSQIIPELSTTQVVVNVIDINDHFPHVRVLSPTGSKDLEIIEESPPGQDIGIVEVSDGDTGKNAQVDCKLINQTIPDVLRLIAINNEIVNQVLLSSHRKYKLTIEKRIDREENQIIEFTIMCYDAGTPSLTSTILQQIKVIDINDHDPISEQTVYTVEISEDSDPERGKTNFEIITIHATDKDEGQNAKLHFSLDHETPTFLLNILKIDANLGILSTLGNLDRETLNEFSLTIICSDYGEPSRKINIIVYVKVIDYNDNSPIYSQSYFQFTLKENNPIGQLIGTFYVTDKDIGKNAELNIFLEDNHEQSNMHLITLHNHLNQPYNEQFTFHSNDILISTNLRQRKYTDYITKFKLNSYLLHHNNNNNSLFLNETLYEVKLYIETILDRENLLMKSNNYVTKAINTYETYEKINYNYNYKKLSQFINRTNYSMLTPIILLIVHAEDNGIPKLSEHVHIRIHITDRNDNRPYFLFPNSTYSNKTKLMLSYKEPIGYAFTQVQAVDDDAGENGTVIYFIHSGNDENYFTLNKINGILSINKEIPYSSIGEHILKIEARDCGQPYLFTITDLIIEIDDSISKAYLSTNTYHLTNVNGFNNLGSSGYKLNFYIVIAIIASACIVSTILISSVFIFLRRLKRTDSFHDVNNSIDMNTSNNCATNIINSPTSWSKVDQSQNYEFSGLSNGYRVIHSIPDCLSQFSNISGQTGMELMNHPNGRLLSSSNQEDSTLDKFSNVNISPEYWQYNHYNTTNRSNHENMNTINMNKHNDLIRNQKIEIFIPSCHAMKMVDITHDQNLNYPLDTCSNYYGEIQHRVS
ncbi:protocadherin beta-18 [Schistosoma japonicum]|nr:protocadherin beta-18 [Schistosoma japonicum]